MSPSPADSEKRRSFRCPIPASRRGAELSFGPIRLPAELVDESAGGFSVLVGDPRGLVVHGTARLRTANGWFEVQVVNIRRLGPQPGEPDGAAADGCARFRLGLKRLGELQPPDEARSAGLPRAVWFRLRGLLPFGASSLVGGLAIAAVAVAAPLAAIFAVWHRHHPVVDRVVDWIPQPWPAQGADAPDGGSRGQWRSGWPEPAGWFADTPADAGDAAGDAVSGAATLRLLAARLPGPAALDLPEAVDYLDLTDAQQRQIRELVQRTSAELNEVGERLRGQSRQEVARAERAALERARQEALGLLSDEQRARWQKLVAEVPDHQIETSGAGTP
jgi:hypothetical protein